VSQSTESMTKRTAFHAVFLSLIIGCATAPHTARHDAQTPPRSSSVSPYPHLKEQIDALLPDSLFPPSNIGMKVVSLTRGETLYELNPYMLFTPASNQKLMTSAAALSLLGEGYCFVTEAFIDTLEKPTIVIRGSGDPLLQTEDIDSIARSLSTILSHDVAWTLAGDVSFFDQVSWGRGWMWDDEPEAYAMFISPLSVNGNSIELRVRPGATIGERVQVERSPSTGFVSVENTAVSVDTVEHDSIQIDRVWHEGSNVIVINGTMSLHDSLWEGAVSVRQPEEYFLTLLSERLEFYGIRISRIELGSKRPGLPAAVSISQRLDSVTTFMNKESDNLSAENLLKTLGAEMYGPPGTASKGIAAIKSFLSNHSIDTTNIVIADGSGVSRYNLVSADAIVRLLEIMYEDSGHFPVFYNSLPIAGADGTLESRMKNSSAQGNLRAKTGSLSGVSALSGYVYTADGELLGFSMLMQNFAAGTRSYRQVQDGIGIFLGEMRRSEF